ncbi:hypothetical protein K492DRAFT_211979, partial [Lichtheimia hyalospora FSU 10163]
MNQFEVLAGDEPASKESELFRFQSIVPDAKIALQEKVQDEYPRFDTNQYPANVSLLACSSTYGYYVAATLEGFIYGSTKSLRLTTKSLEKGGVGSVDDKIFIRVQGAIQHLRLTAEQARIIVTVTNGEVFVYNAKDIVQQRENTAPTSTFKMNDDILDIRPNPDAHPNLAAILFKNNQCKFVDITNGSITASIPNDDITSLCWSPKGKQIVCGKKDGQLETFNTSGDSKSVVEQPTKMKEAGSRYVLGVLWIETHIFLAVYAQLRQSDTDEHIHDAFIVQRPGKSETEGTRYIHLDEVTPVFSMDDRGANMYMEIIRNFSSDMKTAVILAHSAATDISVIAQDDNGDWATWMLPENGLASLPLSEETNMDTFAIGLALDFSTSEPLPPYDPSTNAENVKPMPTMYFLNDEDQICAYHCYNTDLAIRNHKYHGMVDAKDIMEAPSEFPSTPAPAPSTPAPAFTSAPAEPLKQQQQQPSSGFGNSPFGAALQQPGSNDGFAALLSGKSNESSAPPASSGFGFGVAAQSSGSGGGGGGGGGFTSFRSLTVSSNAKNPSSGGMFGSSGFGAAPSTGFGAAPATTTGNTGSAPTFGSTSFGANPSAPQPTQSLASLGKPTEQQPAFGQPSALGSSNTSTTTPTFGSTSFGTQPSQPQSFASLAKTETTTTTGFGSVPAFGKSSFGATPAFGQSSFGTTPAFGQSSFGATPAFGAPAIKPVSEEKKPEIQKEPTFGFGGFASALAKTEEPKNKEKDITVKEEPELEEKEIVVKEEEPEQEEKNIAVKEEEPEEEEKVATVKEEEPEEEPKDVKPEPETVPESAKEIKPEPVEEKEPLAAAETTVPQVAKLPGAPEEKPPTPQFVPSADKPVAGLAFGDDDKKETSSFFSKPPATTGPGLFGSSTQDKPVFGSTTSFGAATTKPSGFASLTTTEETSKIPPVTQGFGSAAATSGFGSIAKIEPSDDKTAQESAVKTTTTATPPSSFSAPAAAPPAPAPKPKPKPTTVEEGMAREFESLYLAMNEDFEKLELKQVELKQVVESQRRQSAASKTQADLQHDNWTVGDALDLSTVADGIASKARTQRPHIIQIKQSLGYFDEDSIKLNVKKSTIEALMETKPDPKLKKELKERNLDKQTMIKWEQLKSRCKTYGQQIDDLESRIQNERIRMRSPAQPQESKSPSLYALYLQLREIDKELKSKQQQVKDLEEQLAHIRFKQVHQNAVYSTSGISLEEDQENEEEPKEESNTLLSTDTRRAALLESTSRYLRRERFLDRIHEFNSQKCV